MAHTARILHTDNEPRIAGKVVPMRDTPALSVNAAEGEQEHLQGKRRTIAFLVSTKQSVNRVYRQARERGGETYQHFSSSARELTRQVRGRAAQIKEDQPLQLLAVIAGSAVILGIVTRIWRSRHHA